MALSRAQLGQVTVVAAGSTQAIATVANNKKIFVKSIMAHNKSGIVTGTAQVYVVPNSGSVSETNRIFNVTVNPNETIFIEPGYPIVVASTGDTIQVGSATTSINYFITGDQEA